MRARVAEIATQAKWSKFFQGVPCPHDLKEFAEKLSEVMPTVKFLPIDTEYVSVPVLDANGVYQTNNSIRVFNEFAVYLDEFPFDIGRINFKDNGARKNKSHTYGVYSRKISNAKYAYHRDQHNMVMATDVKKAVKNAMKYFSPYSTKELAQAYYDPIRSNVGKSQEEAIRNARNFASPLTNDYVELLREIHSLKQRGVEFKSIRFRQMAEGIDDILATYEHENNRNIGAIFVRFYQVGDQTYYSTQHAIEIKKHHNNLQGSEENKAEGKPVSEIPEEIMGSVSVLSILNDGQYVPNVGMKLNSNHFWIERG
jgi:hypothetical protein